MLRVKRGYAPHQAPARYTGPDEGHEVGPQETASPSPGRRREVRLRTPACDRRLKKRDNRALQQIRHPTPQSSAPPVPTHYQTTLGLKASRRIEPTAGSSETRVPIRLRYRQGHETQGIQETSIHTVAIRCSWIRLPSLSVVHNDNDNNNGNNNNTAPPWPKAVHLDNFTRYAPPASNTRPSGRLNSSQVAVSLA